MKRSFKYRVAAYLFITVAAILILTPSVASWLNVKSLPGWFADAPHISLGLDLRGGAQLTYNIDLHKPQVDSLYRAQGHLSDLLIKEANEKQAKQATKKDIKEVKELGASFQVVDLGGTTDPELHIQFTSQEQAKAALALFKQKSAIDELVEDRSIAKPNELVFVLNLEKFQDRQKDTIDTIIGIVKERIDKFGVGEKTIQRVNQDTLLVEVPGQNKEKVAKIRKIIEQTARLEFRLVTENSDYMKKLGVYADTAPVKAAYLGLEIKGEARDKENGKKEYVSDVYIQATDKLVLENFIDKLPSEYKPPADHEVLLGIHLEATKNSTNQKWRTYYVSKQVELTGDTLIDSEVNRNKDPNHLELNGRPEVTMAFDTQGASAFEKITGDNIGRQLAIVLDREVKSAPGINGKIGGGHALITLGRRDPEEALQEAKSLVATLQAGALPAPLKYHSDITVSATLGPETVHRATLAMVIGSIAVILFMLIYYRGAGFIANIAMIFNVIYLLSILALFQATLTLPGIAAVVLTVGMAVDANIIIYERIREELRAGKQPRSAVEAGFNRAFWTVFDAHITNLVAGVVLYAYGTGPIKGFAVSLMIGIVCNLFTSVWLSRAMFEWVVNRKKTTSLSI